METSVTLERLGLDPDGRSAVWIAWIGGAHLLAALEGLAPGFVCPECGRGVNLARPRGVLECLRESPNSRSVSDRCAACQARLHFDNTPLEDRAALRWPKVAIGALQVERPKGLSAPQAEVIETQLRRLAAMRNQTVH